MYNDLALMTSKLVNIYSVDKTKTWLGFGDLGPIFKVTGKFFLKLCLEPDFT